MRKSLEERFWSKVDKNGPVPAHRPELDPCWVWTACLSTNGYGKFGRNWRTPEYAHRLSWEFANGPILDGLFVCHHCDNPACVRPGHLFLGTHQDNTDDMVGKGRHGNCPMPGESNPRSLLTWDQVREIRVRFAAGGVTKLGLSKEYGVGRTTIQHVLKGNTWKAA